MSHAHVAPRGWVLYDGSCGICSQWVPAWAPRLSRLGLAVAPLQDPTMTAKLELTPDALLADIRLVLADGRQIVGADVYRYVLKQIWWGYPLYLLSNVPGFHALFNRAYRTFADRRHRLSKTCGIYPPP